MQRDPLCERKDAERPSLRETGRRETLSACLTSRTSEVRDVNTAGLLEALRSDIHSGTHW